MAIIYFGLGEFVGYLHLIELLSLRLFIKPGLQKRTCPRVKAGAETPVSRRVFLQFCQAELLLQKRDCLAIVRES